MNSDKERNYVEAFSEHFQNLVLNSTIEVSKKLDLKNISTIRY